MRPLSEAIKKKETNLFIRVGNFRIECFYEVAEFVRGSNDVRRVLSLIKVFLHVSVHLKNQQPENVVR